MVTERAVIRDRLPVIGAPGGCCASRAPRPPVPDHRSPVTDHRLLVTDHRLLVTDHRLLVTDHRTLWDERLPVIGQRWWEARSTRLALVSLLLGLLSAGQARGAEDDLEALRRLMGPILAVKVTNRTTLTEARNGAPPQRGDQWDFSSGPVTRTIRYGRYLNQPPDFRGTCPSLANEDMGVGFDGGAFGHWYRGNAIRVLVNGEDVLQARPAKQTEAAAGDPGRLRLVWDLADGGELRLNFAVPDGGGAGIYARIELAPATLAVSSFQVRLTCYPGGFGPAYGQPSHRWVLTARGEAEVPKDFALTADHPFPVLPIPADEGWVFYADKRQNGGSLGLLLLPEEQAAGDVRLSSYGVSTVLTCPASARTLHLGFFAFDTANAAAQQALVASVAQEQRALRALMSNSPKPSR